MSDEFLLSYLKNNPFVLAPMAGITDCAFRSFMKEMGCGIVITELVSANGLHFKSERTKALMKFDETQRPVGIQLFGENIDHLSEAAKECEAAGTDFVDLNFGCPVPKVVSKGGGSAILRDLPTLAKTLCAVKRAINIPLTIKIRTGWDDKSRNSLEVAHIAKEEGITWVAIHGRTRAAGYSGSADWDYISQVKQLSRIPILGNGDLTSAPLAMKQIIKSQCDGVLIGRGCLKNPWIFFESQALHKKSSETVHKNWTSTFTLLHQHLERHCTEKIVVLQLKKLAAWFATGYPNASHFRRDLFSLNQLVDVLDKINQYFLSIKHHEPQDTCHEPFLMGGHG